jgi:hypothetical protein
MKNSWITELNIQNGDTCTPAGDLPTGKKSVLSGPAPNTESAFVGRDFEGGTSADNSLACTDAVGKIFWDSDESKSVEERRTESNIECAECACVAKNGLFALADPFGSGTTVPGTQEYNIFVQLKEKASETCYVKIDISHSDGQSGHMFVGVEAGSDESTNGIVNLPSGTVKLKVK